MSVDYFDDEAVIDPKKTKKGSKTPILDNFSKDLTKLASEGKIDPVIGREKEIKRIAQILTRKRKNNAIIVAESGIGKCVCSDTYVTVMDNKTNETFNIKISDLLQKVSTI